MVQCLCTTIPIYNLTQEKAVKKSTLSPFLEIKIGSKKPSFICKTTAILWLFQERERVSSDRLFRVRAKQPYSSEISNLSMQSDVQGDALPIVNPNVKVGEIKCGKLERSYSFQNTKTRQ